jgi:hypothetical protein
MTRDSLRVRSSGYPADLRDAGPAGPIEVSFTPEAFTWDGKECKRSTNKEMMIVVKTREIRILSAAARRFAPDRKGALYVELGLAKKALAIKISTPERGIKSRGAGSKTPAIHITAAGFVQKMKEQGWPVPGQFFVMHDEKSNMLVVKKPGGTDNLKEILS